MFGNKAILIFSINNFLLNNEKFIYDMTSFFCFIKKISNCWVNMTIL